MNHVYGKNQIQVGKGIFAKLRNERVKTAKKNYGLHLRIIDELVILDLLFSILIHAESFTMIYKVEFLASNTGLLLKIIFVRLHVVTKYFLLDRLYEERREPTSIVK